MDDCMDFNEVVQESLSRGAQKHHKTVLGLTNAAAEEIEVLATLVDPSELDLFLAGAISRMGYEQVLDIQHFNAFYG